MKRYTRLILPLSMLLGMLFCAYAAFFVGVKEDLPFPPSSTRIPLSVIQQLTLAQQWNESASWRNPTAEVYILGDSFEKTADFYRNAFVNRRAWKELPSPAQPKEVAPGQTFQTLSFAKDNKQVIIAFTAAQVLLQTDTALNRVIQSSNLHLNDSLAIVIYGQKS
ncbi:MAG: hypothetical protein HXX08_03640 [Chloroflexi bacterium]|uniref:Uncharacterized protein n=1 Tax=Candidatus Chlorohelix allophototropha TaxID=3003348 RepID=A0A8T7LZT6_9CHLR|nr:hypothetical protein [Chloroflexota bacterium]WJW66831.1 hypothetical protein OZ401_000076 [Chloroflexota bacterium L227-S17]